MAIITPKHIRLLTYNIQSGIATASYSHYLTKSWQYLLPSAERRENLEKIAHFIKPFDIVALQEADMGSLRTDFINQVHFLAKQASFPYRYGQTNRALGMFAQIGNGLLSKLPASDIHDHKLPGRVPGRGVIVVRFGNKQYPLILVIAHLSLGKRAQIQQLDYIAKLLEGYEHIIVMGDMNCPAHSEPCMGLVERINVAPASRGEHTFPSWQPKRELDHILVSPSLMVKNISIPRHVTYSDHLPLAVDIELPEQVVLA